MLLTISIKAFSQTDKKNVVYTHFQTFYIDLNNDGKIDTIILSSSLPDKASFNRIIIAMSGARKKIFKAKDHWEEINQEFLTSNKNLVKSKNIFIKKTKIHTVIIISAGTDGAGYGGEFSIINIENDNIKMVFDYGFGDKADSLDVDIEIPSRLVDLENNDRLCFVYRDYGEVYKTVIGGQIGTYNPFYVFWVGDDYRYSGALSKTYNEQHYIYVPPKYHRQIEIFYPENKKLKPRLWEK